MKQRCGEEFKGGRRIVVQRDLPVECSKVLVQLITTEVLVDTAERHTAADAAAVIRFMVGLPANNPIIGASSHLQLVP